MAQDITCPSLPEEEIQNRQISYSRLVQEIEQEEIQDKVQKDSCPKENVLKDLSASLEMPLNPKAMLQPLLMLNQDGPNIKIHFSSTRDNNPRHYCGSDTTKKSLKQEELHPKASSTLQNHNKYSQPRLMRESKLKSIQENQLEHRRSEDDPHLPRQSSLLESRIVSKVKIQSIDSAWKGPLKPEVVPHMGSTMKKSSVKVEAPIKQVYIRTINDSMEIDLENDAQSHTMKMIPIGQEKQESNKRIPLNTGIGSSLVTLSKRKSTVNSAPEGNGIQQEEKLSKRQENADQFASRRLLQQLNQQSQEKVAHIKRGYEKERQYEKEEVQPIQGQYWHKKQLPQLEKILFSQTWARVLRLSFSQEKNKELLLFSILQLLRVAGKVQFLHNSYHQIIVQFPTKQIAILNSSQFFIGECRKGNLQVQKIRGLEIQPQRHVFSGEYDGGIKSGQGTIVYFNHASYVGVWINGKYQGQGMLTSETGDVYQGSFVQGQKSGKGRQIFKRGDQYFGYYKKNRFQGYGIYSWVNGSRYKGQFKQGKMHGFGHWTSNRGDQYKGEFANSIKQGWGIYRWRNGNVFEGRFQNGNRIDDQSDQQSSYCNKPYTIKKNQRDPSCEKNPSRLNRVISQRDFFESRPKLSLNKIRASNSQDRFRVYFKR